MTSTSTLIYGEERVTYIVQSDPRRTTRIAIHVDPDGSVMVDVPPAHNPDQVASAVQKRARWIVQHVNEAKDRYKNLRPKRYVSGEEVLYLGRRYMLRVEPYHHSKPPVALKGNKLIVRPKSDQPDTIRPLVRAWYRTKARDYFARVLDEKSDLLPWVESRPPFQIQSMTKQWGSCSTSGTILLNPHLIKAPRPCIEYVVLHELAHLKHHDHSPAFFRLIDNHLPDWGKHKRLLDGLVEQLHSD